MTDSDDPSGDVWWHGMRIFVRDRGSDGRTRQIVECATFEEVMGAVRAKRVRMPELAVLAAFGLALRAHWEARSSWVHWEDLVDRLRSAKLELDKACPESPDLAAATGRIVDAAQRYGDDNDFPPVSLIGAETVAEIVMDEAFAVARRGDSREVWPAPARPVQIARVPQVSRTPVRTQGATVELREVAPSAAPPSIELREMAPSAVPPSIVRPVPTWAQVSAVLVALLMSIAAVKWVLPGLALELSANLGVGGRAGIFVVEQCETWFDSDGPLKTTCTGVFMGAGEENKTTKLVHASGQHAYGAAVPVRYVDGFAYEQGVGRLVMTLFFTVAFIVVVVGAIVGAFELVTQPVELRG